MNRLTARFHRERPQCRRNENSKVCFWRTRAIPCQAASRTSPIVSRARLASSTSLRLAHSPSTGPGRGRSRADTPQPASGAGPPASRTSAGCGGRAGCPRSRSPARHGGSGATAAAPRSASGCCSCPAGCESTAEPATHLADSNRSLPWTPASSGRGAAGSGSSLAAPRCAAPAGAANTQTRPGSTATRRASAPPLDPGPLLGPPAGDLDLVTLGCAAGGPLQAPAESPQDAPHVPRMEADSGELLDDLGDATKGPLVGIEPERFWSLAQRLGDRLQFRRRQPRPPPRPPCRPQRRLAALVPAAIPDAGRLPRHPEGAGHLGLGGAAGKHPGGFQAPLLQTAEVAAPGPRLDRHRSPRVRRPCLHTQHAGPNYAYQSIQRSSLIEVSRLSHLP